MPILYQVISIYKNRGKASLASSYGEHAGLYPLEDLKFVSDSPIFKKSDYEVGTIVVWADGEDVYEGVIDYLYESFARIIDVKKLMPINYSVRVPYWKIPEGRVAYKKSEHLDSSINISDDLK